MVSTFILKGVEKEGANREKKRATKRVKTLTGCFGVPVVKGM